MGKKLTSKALADFEANRDVWQEVLDDVREIKAGGGKQKRMKAKSCVVDARIKSRLSQAEFAAALGVSKRTLAQWEQGRRKPSIAAAIRICSSSQLCHPLFARVPVSSFLDSPARRTFPAYLARRASPAPTHRSTKPTK